MNKKNYIIQFIIIILILFACKEKRQSAEKTEELKPIIIKNLGGELAVPINYMFYSPFEDYKLDSVGLKKSKLKIFTSINASCGTCIEEIEKWKKISESLFKYNVPIVLVCNSDDNFEYFKYMCESGKIEFPYPFVLDKNNEFIDLNKFMNENDHFKTLLVNDRNKIILMGNPLHSEEIYNLYIKEIKIRMEGKAKIEAIIFK